MSDLWTLPNTVSFDNLNRSISIEKRIRRDSDPKLFDYIPFYLMENTTRFGVQYSEELFVDLRPEEKSKNSER